MTKRILNGRDDDEYTYHLETGLDGTDYKVGCDCAEHEDDIDWIQCTNSQCDIWHCQQSVADDYNLNKAELKILNEHDQLFKCRAHEVEELDLKKCITDYVNENTDKVISHYNLRKRTKQSGELRDKLLDDDLFNELLHVDDGDESFNDCVEESFEPNAESNDSDIDIDISVLRKKKAPRKRKKAPAKKTNKNTGTCRKRKTKARGKAKDDETDATKKTNRSMYIT